MYADATPRNPTQPVPMPRFEFPVCVVQVPLIEAMFGATWSTRRVETQVRHLRAWFLLLQFVGLQGAEL